MKHNIQLAVSLYSYTQQWVERNTFSFEEMFIHLSRLGIHQVEIVGAQMFSTYPVLKQEEVNQVLGLAKAFGMSFCTYDGYTDRGKKNGIDMSNTEMLREIEVDIQSAKRLGCHILKTHIPFELLEEVEKLAKLYDIRVGIEIHAPELPGNEKTQKYIDEIQRLKIENIGLVPDFGMFILKPNNALINKYLEKGMNEEHLDFIIKNRFNGYSETTMWEKIREMGGSDIEKLAISEMFGYLSWSKEADYEGLKKILPYCIYFHGKFYNIDESRVETTIPYEELLRIIADYGFEGIIATEYEGHSFMLDDAMEQIERHIEMERELLAKL